MQALTAAEPAATLAHRITIAIDSPEEGFLMDAFERVRKIIVDQLGVEPDRVTMEANFRDDLEADSLDLVELIMAFEEEFGGEISDEEAEKIRTVGEAVTYMESHQA